MFMGCRYFRRRKLFEKTLGRSHLSYLSPPFRYRQSNPSSARALISSFDIFSIQPLIFESCFKNRKKPLIHLSCFEALQSSYILLLKRNTDQTPPLPPASSKHTVNMPVYDAQFHSAASLSILEPSTITWAEGKLRHEKTIFF